MPRNTCMRLSFIAYGILVDLTCVIAIIGKNVRTAKVGELPFVVSIAKKGLNYNNLENIHFCTGSVLSDNSVLTVAHCLIKEKTSDFEITAGSVRLDRGLRYQSESWVTYHEWKYGRKELTPSIDDIAIIILKGDGVKHLKITPIPLLPLETEFIDNIRIKIAGWGKTATGQQPIVLRMAALTVMPNDECSEEGTALKGKKFIVPPNYFCSFREPYVKSSCGDGGAPIMNSRTNQLVGINIGVCPTLKGHSVNTTYLNENQMNSHLRVQNYRDFIKRFTI